MQCTDIDVLVRLIVRLVLGGAAGAVLALVLRPIVFATAVITARAVAQPLGDLLGQLPWLDPVYSQAALASLSHVDVGGIAVDGAPGAALHAWFGGVMLEPQRAEHALIRIILRPGSSVLGRLVAAALAHAAVLSTGLLVLLIGRRRGRPALVGAGLACQLSVPLAIVAARPSLTELEASGVMFATNALAPALILRGVALSDLAVGMSPSLVTAVLVGLALLIAYVPAFAVLAARRRGVGPALVTASVIVVASSLGAAAVPIARPSSRIVAAPAMRLELPQRSLGEVSASPHPTYAADRWYLEPRTMIPVSPSTVEVLGAAGQFELRVNGQPQIIRGMGLNTQYALTMTPEQRRAQLEADFAALAKLGVNTVVGWDPAEFDEALLESAQTHGIGVVVPFDLDPEADYTDPEVRAALTRDVLAWVARYRDAPALRMWGLGNEVLHKIVHPAWVGPQEPARERNAQAFSDWLAETADAIHAVDPHHPVTYRSAEDAFVGWVVDALRRRGGGARQWFVWGTNCYQDHLADIVDNWPDSGFDGALWVSEFAPGTVAVPDRPVGFEAMWSTIRRHPQWVLGGAVYAWTRNGPEGVDRNFGLTDDGAPVDGRSLAMLSELFRGDQ